MLVYTSEIKFKLIQQVEDSKSSWSIDLQADKPCSILNVDLGVSRAKDLCIWKICYNSIWRTVRKRNIYLLKGKDHVSCDDLAPFIVTSDNEAEHSRHSKIRRGFPK